MRWHSIPEVPNTYYVSSNKRPGGSYRGGWTSLIVPALALWFILSRLIDFVYCGFSGKGEQNHRDIAWELFGSKRTNERTAKLSGTTTLSLKNAIR